MASVARVTPLTYRGKHWLGNTIFVRSKRLWLRKMPGCELSMFCSFSVSIEHDGLQIPTVPARAGLRASTCDDSRNSWPSASRHGGSSNKARRTTAINHWPQTPVCVNRQVWRQRQDWSVVLCLLPSNQKQAHNKQACLSKLEQTGTVMQTPSAPLQRLGLCISLTNFFERDMDSQRNWLTITMFAMKDGQAMLIVSCHCPEMGQSVGETAHPPATTARHSMPPEDQSALRVWR